MCEECGVRVSFKVHERGAGVGQLARVGGGARLQPFFVGNTLENAFWRGRQGLRLWCRLTRWHRPLHHAASRRRQLAFLYYLFVTDVAGVLCDVSLTTLQFEKNSLLFCSSQSHNAQQPVASPRQHCATAATQLAHVCVGDQSASVSRPAVVPW